MDEAEAWNSFLKSGKVADYLRYRFLSQATDGVEPPRDSEYNEIQNQGTDPETTEYR